jgi:glycosyltransferase involved in cell wall biosynthesis
MELIQNIIGDDTRFKFYQNSENKGCGFTKRRCAELATGEICAFLDPDDAITEEALTIMVAEHEKFPNASMVYSKHYFCDENLKN